MHRSSPVHPRFVHTFVHSLCTAIMAVGDGADVGTARQVEALAHGFLARMRLVSSVTWL